MSRFTGSEFKVSRRLGYSITETGKELKKRNFAPGQHGKVEENLVNMVFNYKKNKKFVLLMELAKNNSRDSLKWLRNMKVNKVIIS